MCSALAIGTLASCGESSTEAPASNSVVDESPAVENKATESTAVVEVTGDDAVTDEIWDELQQMYSALVDTYNATADFYNDASIMPNAEIEAGLTTATELIETIGNVEREDVTMETAEGWVDAMLAVNEIFGALMFYDVSTGESGSFVGPFETDEENDLLTITDNVNGLAITFSVEEVDGGYYLNMGEYMKFSIVENDKTAELLK